MQRSLDHVRASLELGRNGVFNKIPSLRTIYKSHRRSELIRQGLADENMVPRRDCWGEIVHARLVKKAPTAAAAAAVMEDDMDFDGGAQSFIDELDSDDEDVAMSSGTCADAILEVAASLAADAAFAIDVDVPTAIRPRAVKRQVGFYSLLLA